jgi:hypothetical protein
MQQYSKQPQETIDVLSKGFPYGPQNGISSLIRSFGNSQLHQTQRRKLLVLQLSMNLPMDLSGFIGIILI